MQASEIINIIVLGAMAIVGYFLRRVLASLDELVTRVGTQNGRIGKLEEWKDNEKEDMRDVKRNIRDVEIDLGKLYRRRDEERVND